MVRLNRLNELYCWRLNSHNCQQTFTNPRFNHKRGVHFATVCLPKTSEYYLTHFYRVNALLTCKSLLLCLLMSLPRILLMKSCSSTHLLGIKLSCIIKTLCRICKKNKHADIWWKFWGYKCLNARVLYGNGNVFICWYVGAENERKCNETDLFQYIMIKIKKKKKMSKDVVVSFWLKTKAAPKAETASSCVFSLQQNVFNDTLINLKIYTQWKQWGIRPLTKKKHFVVTLLFVFLSWVTGYSAPFKSAVMRMSLWQDVSVCSSTGNSFTRWPVNLEKKSEGKERKKVAEIETSHVKKIAEEITHFPHSLV